jgi:hypothetical protein
MRRSDDLGSRFVSYRTRRGLRVLATDLEGGAALLVPFVPEWAARGFEELGLPNSGPRRRRPGEG